MRRQRQHWSMNEVHTQTVPGGGPEPGELLYTLGPDWKRIGLESLIRLAASAFALGLAAYQGTEPSLLPPVAAVLLVFVLWPLRHGRDGMELRRNGVVCRGKFYPVGGRVTWRGVNTVFLSSTYLHLGQKKGINVSFMKDAEKLFARAYSNTVS